MSHLAHIITVKKALIDLGVTNPVDQIAICRTAYVRALAMFQNRGRLPKDQHADFYTQILSYWNEVTPVQGNLVIAELRRFNAEMTAALLGLGHLDAISVEITPIAELQGKVKISEIPGYKELVDILSAEAEEQLTAWAKDGFYCVKGGE